MNFARFSRRRWSEWKVPTGGRGRRPESLVEPIKSQVTGGRGYSVPEAEKEAAMRSTHRLVYPLTVLLGMSLFSSSVTAQQGALVSSASAPIYAHPTGDKVETTTSKGDSVGPVDQFEEKNGRVHVVYFPKNADKGIQRTAWMNPSDLLRFDYECTCDDRGKCSPLLTHFATAEWNPCFKQARDRSLAGLTTPGTAPALPGAPARRATGTISNADIIKMTKADLGDSII